MSKNIWQEFDAALTDCYNAMITNGGVAPWIHSFDVFQSILLEKGTADTGRYGTWEQLEEDTDWEHDFSGWLDDLLCELDMHKAYEELLQAVTWLWSAFDWTDGDDFDLRFIRADALTGLGEVEEAYDYCKEWLSSSPEDHQARAALIYACISKSDYAEAEAVLEEAVQDFDACNEDNEILFIAAEKLFEKNGDKKRLARVKKAIEICDEGQEQALKNEWFSDDDELAFEGELPFS